MDINLKNPTTLLTPKQPYRAGFWLIAMIPSVVVLALPFEMLGHQEILSDFLGLLLIVIVSAGMAYRWSISLARRSGWEANKWVGISGALAFPLMLMSGYAGYDLIFESVIKALRVSGTSKEFMVIFVLWTGIVAGGCGFAVGLALKHFALALKLLGVGFVTGAVIFFIIASGMALLGFQVGTPRPDGIPSMPVVTLLGIWSTALAGSQFFGWIMARNHKQS